MEDLAELRKAIERVELVDGHAHNIVALDSTVPFLSCFSEATGEEALSYAPHTINFKVRYIFLFLFLIIYAILTHVLLRYISNGGVLLLLSI